MSFGQTGEFDDALNRLNSTKPVDSRDPFIGEGDHVLALVELEPFRHQQHGPAVRAAFEVLESRVHAIGTRVAKIWFLVKPSKWATQATDADRWADFLRRISGAPEGFNVVPWTAALLRDRLQEQQLRGMIIRATGVNTSKKADKPFVDVRWTNIPQDQEQIKTRRAAIEAKGIKPVGQQQQQAPAQQYAPQQPMQQPYAGNPQGFGGAVPGQPGMYGAPSNPAPAQPQQYAPQTPNNPANYAQQFPAQPMQQQMPMQQPQYAPPQAPQQQFAPQQMPMPMPMQPQQMPYQPPQQPGQPVAPGMLNQIPGYGK